MPWPEWGETDVMLGMAADLHDRLTCTCGCGQWEADAHDPDKADQIVVAADTCYVRRAIDRYVEDFKPAPDAVLSVRFVADRVEADRAAFDDIRARFPERFGASLGERADHEEQSDTDDRGKD